MRVLKLRPYPRAVPVLSDEERDFDNDPVIPWLEDELHWQSRAQQQWPAYALQVVDDGDVVPAAVSFGLDDEPAFIYRNRVAAWKIFYPSRRGGSPDNNAATGSAGIEDDQPWVWHKHRQWNLGKAFIDDDFYVNNCTEDYLWIALQAFWQTPLVAANDDEIIPTSASLGVEDDFPWVAGTSRNWKCAVQRVEDEVFPTAAAARSYVFII